MRSVFTLPFPVSTNALWRSIGRGRVIKSEKYRDWCAHAGAEIMRQRPKAITGEVMLSYEVQRFPDNRRRDIGNLEKGVTDLLVEHRLIEGDDCRFVQEIRLRWNPEVEGVRVTIEDFANSHSYVYVIAAIENDRPVAPTKIGIARHPGKRLKQLQTGSHRKLEVIGAFCCPGRQIAEAIEKSMHEALTDKSLTGEWFDVCPVLAVVQACMWLHEALAVIGFKDDALYKGLRDVGATAVISAMHDYAIRCRAEGRPLYELEATGWLQAE